MKRLLLILLQCLSISSTQAAEWDTYDDPVKPFTTEDNVYETVQVSWRTADDATAACNQERKKRGYSSYQTPILACALWDGNTCLIITAKQTTMHTLGHEIRHCYQGPWHEE